MIFSLIPKLISAAGATRNSQYLGNEKMVSKGWNVSKKKLMGETDGNRLAVGAGRWVWVGIG